MRDPLVTIEHLEVSVSILLVAVAATLHSRKKNIAIKKHPEYRYYLWGLYAKVLGGVFFTLIYLYYYGNGDTVSFYLSAIPLVAVGDGKGADERGGDERRISHGLINIGAVD